MPAEHGDNGTRWSDNGAMRLLLAATLFSGLTSLSEWVMVPHGPGPAGPAAGGSARGSASGVRTDIAEAVKLLDSPDPAARREAQELLGRSLTGTLDRDAVTRAIEAASREARRRVARVLGREDRFLGLAVELCAVSGGPSAQVGREAIEAQLLRWSPSVFDEPEVAVFDAGRQRTPMPSAWIEGASMKLSLDPLAGGAVNAFDRLDRLGLGPAPIIVDPRLVERYVRRPEAEDGAPDGAILASGKDRLEGTWSEVLDRLCELHGAAYQVQGYRYPRESRASDWHSLAEENGEERGPGTAALARPFVHVVPSGTTEFAPVGRDLRTPAATSVVGWCMTVLRDGDIVRQRAAARALAGLDWPAAIQWLEVRWLMSGDVAALEGLMAAAARGRVAPSLQRPDVLRKILRIVDSADRELEGLRQAKVILAGADAEAAELAISQASNALDERAMRFASGLARLAPLAIASDAASSGGLLGTVALENFEGAPPTGRWLRLVMVEGLGLENGQAAAAARRVLDGELEARSLRQALRTFVMVSESGALLPLRSPEAILEEAQSSPAGLGLELGLAGAVAGDFPWPKPLEGSLELLSEALIWGAVFLDRRADGGGGVPPQWLVEVAILAARRGAQVRAAQPRATRRASRDGALHRAAREVSGDMGRALGNLVAQVGPMLGPADRLKFESEALRAGLAGPDLRQAALERARQTLKDEGGSIDPQAVEAAWLDLAALVGPDPGGQEAMDLLRSALILSLQRGRTRETMGSSSALVSAAEAAIDTLRRGRNDVAAETFADDLREAAGLSRHPLGGTLYRNDWPPAPYLVPRDLERLEPALN